MLNKMGTKIYIKNSNFTNYVDIEYPYSIKRVDQAELKFINPTTVDIGGMAILGSKLFVSKSSGNQLGVHYPIDIEGATSITIINSFGQSSGIHAKLLDSSGAWVKDIIGSVSSITPTINIHDNEIPSNCKYLFVNGINTALISVEVEGFLNTEQKEFLTSAPLLVGNGFIKNDGTVIASTVVAGRKVVEYDVSSINNLYVCGLFGNSSVAGQNNCLGVFLDVDNNVVSSLIEANILEEMSYLSFNKIQKPLNATKFRCNVLDADPVIYFD